MISLSSYLILGSILFAISIAGIFLNRKNVVVLLMCIELMLLSANINFVAFSHYLNDISGQVFVFFILTVAAAEAAIGLAAINSLLPIDESRCVDLNAEEEIRSRGGGKRIAIIGHFPFVKRLKETADKVWVFELPGRERPGDITGDEMSTLLPQAEVVGITSTTLINHTLGSILDLVAPDAYKMMLGPSTPLSPVLFDHGLNALSGSIVIDRDQVLRCISQGANFRQVKGIRKVIMVQN